jgi:hypothetical protein
LEREAKAVAALSHPNILAIQIPACTMGSSSSPSCSTEDTRAEFVPAPCQCGRRLISRCRWHAVCGGATGCRPPRSEAREPLPSARRSGEDSRLRARGADQRTRMAGVTAVATAAALSEPDGHGHRRLHGAGTGSRSGRRCACRPLALGAVLMRRSAVAGFLRETALRR